MDECIDLIGAVIRQAGLDYRLARKKGYIVNKMFRFEIVDGMFIFSKWEKDTWLYQVETVRTAITFWHKGGVEELCELLPINSDYLREKYDISK